ncbi:MAG: hypothetical protein SX243_19460 [Acidobacteriota bacterium]|nr:hypothetical protein [Acidobacteriota bacterium]
MIHKTLSLLFGILLLVSTALPSEAAQRGKKKSDPEGPVPEGRVEVTGSSPESLVLIFVLNGQGEEIRDVAYDARFSRVRRPCPPDEPTEGSTANTGEPQPAKMCPQTVLRRIGFPPDLPHPDLPGGPKSSPGQQPAADLPCERLELQFVHMNGRPISETVPRHGVRPKKLLRWFVAGSLLEDGGTVKAVYDCPRAEGEEGAPSEQASQAGSSS